MKSKPHEDFMLFGTMPGGLGFGLTGCGPLITKFGTTMPCGVSVPGLLGSPSYLHCLGYGGPCTCTSAPALLQYAAASNDLGLSSTSLKAMGH